MKGGDLGGLFFEVGFCLIEVDGEFVLKFVLLHLQAAEVVFADLADAAGHEADGVVVCFVDADAAGVVFEGDGVGGAIALMDELVALCGEVVVELLGLLLVCGFELLALLAQFAGELFFLFGEVGSGAFDLGERIDAACGGEVR